MEKITETLLKDAYVNVYYVSLGSIAIVDEDRNKNKQINLTIVYHKEKKGKHKRN